MVTTMIPAAHARLIDGFIAVSDEGISMIASGRVWMMLLRD